MRVDLAKKRGNVILASILIVAVIVLTIMTTYFVADNAGKSTDLDMPDVGSGNVDSASEITAEPYNDVVTDAGKLPKGQGAETYILTLPQDWIRISTAPELKAWLLDNYTSKKSAYLAADIPAFAWGDGVNAVWTNNTDKNMPQIAADVTLDGCGFSIELSQALPDNTSIGSHVSKFTGATAGTMRNIQFVATNYFSTHGVANSGDRYTGMVAARLYGTIDNCKFTLAGTLRTTSGYASEPGANKSVVLTCYPGGIVGTSEGLIKNSTFVLASTGALTGYSSGAKKSLFGSWSGNGRTFVGVMIGWMASGSVLNNTLINEGGSIKSESNGSDKQVGGVSGTFEWDGVYTISGLVMKGFNFASQALSGSNAGTWGTIVGWFSKGTVNTSGIFYISSQPALYMSGWNNKDNKNRYMDVQHISDMSVNVYFDKDPALENKYIITKTGLGSNGDIYWGLHQQEYTTLKGTDVDSTLGQNLVDSPKKSVNDLYTKNISNAIIVDKVQFEMKAHNGHPLSIIAGTEVTIDTVTGKTVAFDGGAQGISATFKKSNGEAFTPVAGATKALYNDIVGLVPSLPSATPYVGKIRATDNAAFAYLDTTAKVMAKINDSKTGRLTITRGVTATTTDYISGTWAKEEKIVTTTIANAASSIISPPTRVGISFDGVNIAEYQSWTDANRYKSIMNKITAGDTAYSFALFVGDIQVTELSSDRYKINFDNVTPEMSMHSTHNTGGLRDLSQVFTNYDLMDDGNALPELWFSGTAGPSGLVMQVRAARNGGAYSEWQQIPNGERPMINGMPAQNVMRQRFYFNSETEAAGRSNLETFNGTWEFELRVINGAGTPAMGGDADGVIKVTVKINYNTDYTLDSNIVFEDGAANDGIVEFTPAQPTFIMGDDAGYTVTVNNSESAPKNYYIKSIDGVAIDDVNKYLYEGSTLIASDAITGVKTVNIVMGYTHNDYYTLAANAVGDITELDGKIAVTFEPNKEKYAVGDSVNVNVVIDNTATARGYEYYVTKVNGIAIAEFNGSIIIGTDIIITEDMTTAGAITFDIEYGKRAIDYFTVSAKGTGAYVTELDGNVTINIAVNKAKYAIGDTLTITAQVDNTATARGYEYYVTKVNGIAIAEFSGSIIIGADVIITEDMLTNGAIVIEVECDRRTVDALTVTTSQVLGEDNTPLVGKVIISGIDKEKYAIGDTIIINVAVTNDGGAVEYFITSINGTVVELVDELNATYTLTITEEMMTSDTIDIVVVFGERATVTPEPEPAPEGV